MATNRQDFEQRLNDNSFFAKNIRMWHSAINYFGSVNVIDILGLRRRMTEEFGHNLHQALENPIFRNLVDLTLGREIELSQRDPRGNHLGGYNGQYFFFRWIRQNLLQDVWRRAYADQLRNGQFADAYLSEAGSSQADLSSQIPLATLNRQRTVIIKEKVGECMRCGQRGHFENDCERGGYIQRDENGQVRAKGKYPRCFICNNRNLRESETVFHWSDNCPFRHPRSRIGINRPCVKCGGPMDRCWNCSVPYCKNKQPCDGHRANNCPFKRYVPDMTQLYGPSFRYRMNSTVGGFLNLPFGVNINLRNLEATDSQQEICTVCQDDINLRGRVRKLCGHEFHLDCFEQMVQRWKSEKPDQCPICRQQMQLDQTVGELPSTSMWDGMQATADEPNDDRTLLQQYLDIMNIPHPSNEQGSFRPPPEDDELHPEWDQPYLLDQVNWLYDPTAEPYVRRKKALRNFANYLRTRRARVHALDSDDIRVFGGLLYAAGRRNDTEIGRIIIPELLNQAPDLETLNAIIALCLSQAADEHVLQRVVAFIHPYIEDRKTQANWRD